MFGPWCEPGDALNETMRQEDDVLAAREPPIDPDR